MFLFESELSQFVVEEPTICWSCAVFVWSRSVKQVLPDSLFEYMYRKESFRQLFCQKTTHVKWFEELLSFWNLGPSAFWPTRFLEHIFRTGCLRDVSCLRFPWGDFLFKWKPLNNNSCVVFRYYACFEQHMWKGDPLMGISSRKHIAKLFSESFWMWGRGYPPVLWGEQRGSQGRGFEHRSIWGFEHVNNFRATHDQTSCYLRPPLLGAPLVPSRTFFWMWGRGYPARHFQYKHCIIMLKRLVFQQPLTFQHRMTKDIIPHKHILWISPFFPRARSPWRPLRNALYKPPVKHIIFVIYTIIYYLCLDPTTPHNKILPDCFTPPNAKVEHGSASTSVLLSLG